VRGDVYGGGRKDVALYIHHRRVYGVRATQGVPGGDSGRFFPEKRHLFYHMFLFGTLTPGTFTLPLGLNVLRFNFVFLYDIFNTRA
jgi:hypothetical protein